MSFNCEEMHWYSCEERWSIWTAIWWWAVLLFIMALFAIAILAALTGIILWIKGLFLLV